MGFIFKNAVPKQIFQKNSLKNILGILIVLQMKETDTADHVGVLLNRTVDLVFASPKDLRN